jgi:hypothetical protein
MADLDHYVDVWYNNSLSDYRYSQKNLDNIIRQNNKILVEATNRSIDFTTKKQKIGSSFEALLRSVGLGVGVLAGGPVGAATLSSIAGGIGKGAGDYLGNRIYGKSLSKLDSLITDNKYKQLQNYSARSATGAALSLNDEFYKQANTLVNETINEINQQ